MKVMRKIVRICIMAVLAGATAILLNGSSVYLTDSGTMGIGILPVVVICATSGLVYGNPDGSAVGE